MDHKVLKDSKGLKVVMVPLDRWVQLEFKDFKDHQGQKVIKDFKDFKVLKVMMAILD